MKCPNCSFENRDDVTLCRVCGNLLINTSTTSDAPTKRSKYNDTPDDAIDDALSSLFGEDDDDELDAAAMAKLLSKRRSQRKFDDPEEPHIEEQTQNISDEEPAYNMRIIWLVSAIIIILLILFKTSWSSIPWKYNSDSTPEQTTSSLSEPTSQSTSSITETTETESTTETETESAPPSTTQATSVPSTEPTTGPKLEGFISAGGFKGGTQTSGQDIAYARFGLHDGFERVVFDIYEWIGGKPTDTVPEIGPYETSLSQDGKTLTITLEGAINAYAKQEVIDLKGSKTLVSIAYDTPSTGESVQIKMNFSEPIIYKVFNLKGPARLVVDFSK